MNNADAQWRVYECPICGKKFIPTANYLYKLRSIHGVKYYCSYTCWRKDGGDSGK